MIDASLVCDCCRRAVTRDLPGRCAVLGTETRNSVSGGVWGTIESNEDRRRVASAALRASLTRTAYPYEDFPGGGTIRGRRRSRYRCAHCAAKASFSRRLAHWHDDTKDSGRRKAMHPPKPLWAGSPLG